MCFNCSYYYVYLIYLGTTCYFCLYKLFIYYLSDFLTNIILLLLLYSYFCALNKKILALYLYFTLSLVYYTKIFFFGIKYYTYSKFLSFNISLLMGLNFIHPPLTYYVVIALIFNLSIFTYLTYLTFMREYTLFFLVYFTFLLGGFWGTLMSSWGFYWVYDLIEYIPILLLFLILYNIHYSSINFIKFFLTIQLIIVNFLIIFLRFGFWISRHSYFYSYNSNIIILVFFLTLFCIGFFNFFHNLIIKISIYTFSFYFFFISIFIKNWYLYYSFNYFFFILLIYIFYIFFYRWGIYQLLYHSILLLLYYYFLFYNINYFFFLISKLTNTISLNFLGYSNFYARLTNILIIFSILVFLPKSYYLLIKSNYVIVTFINFFKQLNISLKALLPTIKYLYNLFLYYLLLLVYLIILYS